MREGRFIEIDESFADIFSKTAPELLEQSPQACLPPSIDHQQRLQNISYLSPDKGIQFLQILIEEPPQSDTIYAVRDITTRKLHQDQLIFTNRMVSTGLLTASIVHDLSSPLMVLNHHLELLAPELLKNESGRWEPIHHSIEHINSLFSNLRDFARSSRQKGLSDPTQIIQKSLSLIEPQIKGTVTTDLGPLSQVNISPENLSQVLINLLMNAAQATNQHNKIHIHAYQKENRFHLIIADDGPGIPEEFRSQIFEPFFSNKPKGTGLGLAITYSILSQNSGSIVLEKSKKGCSFHIELPCLPAPIHSSDLPLILVIDDEPLICELIEDVLEDYQVDRAGTAEEGLRKIQIQSYDLILCDLSLPKRGGLDFFQELQEDQHYQNKIIFITGGGYSPAEQRFIERKNIPVLAKPFQLKALQDLVEKHIEGQP